MPSEHPLMRPLRSDSLKARPVLQAQWAPAENVYTFETSAQTPAEAVQTKPAAISPVSVSDESPAEAAEEVSEPTFLPYNKNESVSQSQPSPPTLSETIADIMSSSVEEEDDEESPLMQDAVPDRLIPQPVCVPLFEQAVPARKKHRWFWLMLPVFAAGAGFAAWKCGLLSFILP